LADECRVSQPMLHLLAKLKNPSQRVAPLRIRMNSTKRPIVLPPSLPQKGTVIFFTWLGRHW